MRALIILLLIVLNLLVLPHAFEEREFSVAFLDVGQGDATLITSPSGAQVLIDGGRDGSALRELGAQLPFFDRTIDVVIATHPDLDHIGGLPEIMARYDVGAFIESSVLHETSATHALKDAVHKERVPVYEAARGMRLVLGAGAYADILFPDRDVSHIESNAGSIVMRVVYGETEFMLTGDSPQSIEKYLVSLDAPLESDVLKVGHHGSRTSTSGEFMNKVKPKIAVISAGEGNSYGHPHADVLETLANSGARVLSTIDSGTIVIRSSGYTLKY